MKATSGKYNHGCGKDMRVSLLIYDHSYLEMAENNEIVPARIVSVEAESGVIGGSKEGKVAADISFTTIEGIRRFSVR